MTTDKSSLPTILFLSSNGIGRGHLNRQLAVAIRLKKLQPVFLTMSHAARIVLDHDIPVHYFPYHSYSNRSFYQWNLALEAEIKLLLEKTGARHFIFDFSFVFDAVDWTLTRHKDLTSIWIRRGMWPMGNEEHLKKGSLFTHIIEPSDLADELDEGATKSDRENSISVPPIILIDPEQRRSRSQVRSFYNIPENSTVIAIDLLGNEDPGYMEIRSTIIELLLENPDIIIVEFSPILRFSQQTSHDLRHRIIQVDDGYSWSRGWDAMITRAGYNTFHENILGAVPTLFIPNEAPERDVQENRALWAQNNQLSLMLRVSANQHDIKKAIDQLTNPDWQKISQSGCRNLRHGFFKAGNGAQILADCIDQNIYDQV